MRSFSRICGFFVAWLDDVAVGCGGVALLDGYAALKRMFVAESARGQAEIPTRPTSIF
jgi:hypothetical protein